MRLFRASSEETAETIQNLKEELSRRESEISNLNRKVDQLIKDLNEKTGNASDAYAKLNEIHQVRKFASFLIWIYPELLINASHRRGEGGRP